MDLGLAETPANVHGELRDELLAGLLASPKYINAKFFYDEQGSALFGEICDLPEYYPTRTEIGILKTHGKSIAAAIGPDCVLFEPGAGNCSKVRHLLSDLQPAAYIPLDISGQYLLSAAMELREEFPGLLVEPLIADFSGEFELPRLGGDGRRVLFYPGSTIGNFMPPAARDFLARIAGLIGSGGGLLIGIDLHKDTDILHAAYNDSRGVTARFNRNILLHANHLLDARFAPEMFDHVAFYNEDERRIEMHLQSQQEQRVPCGDRMLKFYAGERLLTEYSYKYSLDDFSSLAVSAGFTPKASWVDEQNWFGVLYYEIA
jgi:dimethylhistidine N-methyltransferase